MSTAITADLDLELVQKVTKALPFAIAADVQQALSVTLHDYHDKELHVLPFLVKDLMLLVSGINNLTNNQRHTFVTCAITVTMLGSIEDAALRKEILDGVNHTIDIYYSLSKGAHVFQSVTKSIHLCC